MNTNFFDISAEGRMTIIRKAEDMLGLPGNVIEKDFWVCWLLEQLFDLPLKMAFKGGTSLSKAYGLIHRFSEDVDVTIDYRYFANEANLESVSRAQLRKITDDLRKQMQILAKTKILPHLQERSKSRLPLSQFDITLSEDGEKLRYFYPTLLNQDLGYLRDHVLIEFGIRNSSEPCDQLVISPLLATMTDQSIIYPQPVINTLSPVRTFWEKATLIHVECNRKRLVESPERMSRHWYDLYMLANSWVGEEAFIQRKIFESVVINKKTFFNASYAHYDRCLNGNLRLIPDDLEEIGLAKDYKRMKEAGMFSLEPPKFTDIIHSLHNLEIKINQTYTKNDQQA